MLYHNVRVMGAYLQIVDALAVGASSAVVWNAGTALGAWHWEHPNGMIGMFAGLSALAFAVVGGRMHAYHARRTEDILHEVRGLAEITLYATGLTCVGSALLHFSVPPSFCLTVLVANTIAVVACRLVMRGLIRYFRRKGSDYRVWLIVGNNARAGELVAGVQNNPHFGIRIAEVVDLPDKPASVIRPNLSFGPRAESMQSRVLTDVEGIRDLVANNVIDEVVVTLPIRSFYDDIQQIVDICSEAGISVKLPPEAFARFDYRTEVVHVGKIPMVTHFTGPSNHTQLLVKRLVDAVGAGFSLVLLAPLMVLIAIAIKLTTHGPVFFLQTRVGLHGRRFRMIKFRSMTKDAPARRHELERFNERDSVAFKMREDPRVTPVGRTLRRFHLDELPQLWNVLLGDMSLVGPRPLPPGEATGNEWWQRRRLSMPPGLTCFWQVRRDPTMPFREWMRLDLAYVDRWSVWLDIKLIALTLPAVVRGAGW